MTQLVVVSDASPLIALAKIDRLERLEPVSATCIIPSAVEREIRPSVVKPPWISVRAPIHPRIVGAALGRGESEALALTMDLPGHSILVDERRARRTAKTLGLPMIGTVGLVVRAKNDGIIDSIRPTIDALLRTRFFLSDRLIDEALREAGELPSP